MARYTATDARKQFFHLLDAAERGEDVVLERHGVRFKLVLDTAEQPEAVESSLIVADEAVLSGNWTWTSDEEGQLQFKSQDD